MANNDDDSTNEAAHELLGEVPPELSRDELPPFVEEEVCLPRLVFSVIVCHFHFDFSQNINTRVYSSSVLIMRACGCHHVNHFT